MKQLVTAGLVVIKKRKLLLAFSKNKKAWYLPGGKIDNDETTLAVLIRELKEELNLSLTNEELKFYTHISAPAFGENENVIMEQDCFLHNLIQTPKPTAEIGDVKYFNTNSYQTEKQVP